MANKKYQKRGSARTTDVREKQTSKSVASDTKDKFKYSKSISGNNDFSWYNYNPTLTDLSTRFSFNEPLGDSLYYWNVTEGTEVINMKRTLPGICTIETLPTCGVATDYYSPVNTAARAIFAFLTNNSGRATNYTSSDVMMLILSVDQVFAMLNHCFRAIQSVQQYNGMNRYVGVAMLRAMGFNYDDLVKNKMSFYSKLVDLAMKINEYPIPAEFALLERHSWLYRHIWMDEDITKCQFYMYRPYGYYQLDEAYSEKGWALRPMPLWKNNSGQTVYTYSCDQWLDKLNNLIYPITMSESVDIIKADILRNYGKDNLWSFTPAPYETKITPEYNPNVLMAIHNCKPMEFEMDSLAIVNDVESNLINFTPTYIFNSKSGTGARNAMDWKFQQRILLDMPVEQPGPEEIMEYTRLVTYITADSIVRDQGVHRIIHHGSELVPSICYWTMKDVGEVMERFYVGASDVQIQAPSKAPSTLQLTNALKLASLSSAFNYAPIFEFTVHESDKIADPSAFLIGRAGNITNYTQLTSDMVDRLHRAAILSLFSVPTGKGI